MCAEQKAQKTAARLGGSLKILKENQRLLNFKDLVLILPYIR